MKDETINVKKGSGIKTVDLIATAGNEKSDVTVNVVQKQYKVTINMYSPDFEMKSGVSDVYIYNKNGAEKEFVPLNNTIEDTENNVTWLQGTTYVSFNSLGIIGRPTAGSWDGQDSNQYYVINEEKSEITLWYVFGKKPVIEKPVITKADHGLLVLKRKYANHLNLMGTENGRSKFLLNQLARRLISWLCWILPALTGSRMEEITPLHFHKSRTLYAQA